MKAGWLADQMLSTFGVGRFTCLSMVVTSKVESGQLADLVKQVQAGNEVLLTQGDKLVARLVPAHVEKSEALPPLTFRSLKGHQVLTPVISQAEIAEELFGRE